MAQDFLKSMAANSHKRVSAATRIESLESLRERALLTPRPARMKLGSAGFDIIAEIKISAPSAGKLADASTDIAARAIAYAEAGAVAVSVLTEPKRFSGSLEHLAVASAALGEHRVPAMRKDFLVHPYQVWEARAAGAGGVLLILQMLDDEALSEMLKVASAAGLFVLLEAFDKQDLMRCRRVAVTPGLLVGLNCRNLRSLAVEPGRFQQLAGDFPEGPPRVAESGLDSPDDVTLVAELGYDLALVGSALMKSEDPGELLQSMLDAGREGRV